MPHSTSSLFSLAVMLAAAMTVQAQQEVIWGSIIISTFGDRVPIYSPNFSVITPLGAQQMYDSGSYYRQRYISNPANRGAGTIPNISVDVLMPNQAVSYTPSDFWLQQSAQAFMNGLYPPLGSNAQILASAQSANGSSMTGPLNGLQYPWLQSAGPSDPNYAYLNGKENCPAWQEEKRRTIDGQPWFQNVMNGSQPRYNSVNATAFADVTPNSVVGFSGSYEVWEWLNYIKTHNRTLSAKISDDDVAWSRTMAASYYGQIFRSTDNAILTLPGRTLSTQIIQLLLSNAYYKGTGAKINMLFTPWESLLSLMYLLGLPQKYPDLNTIPNPASSLAIELYSNVETYQNPLMPVTNPTYPDDPYNNLSIRVLYRNATGANATLASYTMPSVSAGTAQGVQLNQFVSVMKTWSLGANAWCAVCGGAETPVFCTGLSAYNNGGYVVAVNGESSGSSTMRGPSPAVAGVIGAIVTLIVTGLAALLLMLLGGFRLRRDRPSVVANRSKLALHKRQQSSTGGFKGAEKMASDVDLPKGGSSVGASILPAHNRTASWEMREGSALRQGRDSQNTVVGEPGPEIRDVAGIRVTRDEDDELSGLKPVKVRESF